MNVIRCTAWQVLKHGNPRQLTSLPAGCQQVNTLFVLMGDKKEDDEFVLQIAFSFHKFLLHKETRTSLLDHTQARARRVQ
jgi:hypothetical protein